MKIFADKVQLADHAQVESLRINGGRLLQVDQFVRGEEVKVRDRGNRSTQIEFTVNRVHKSFVEAERFMLEHDGQVPVRAAVFLMVCDYGGPRVEKKLTDAGIEVVERSYWGATTMHTYRVIGGKVK